MGARQFTFGGLSFHGRTTARKVRPSVFFSLGGVMPLSLRVRKDSSRITGQDYREVIAYVNRTQD